MIKSREIDPTRLGFDIDGVVADTMHLFIRIAREDHGVEVRFEDITEYALESCLDIPPDVIEDVIIKLIEGDRHDTLEPLAGAPEVLSRMSTRVSPIRFVTARPNPRPIIDWMAQKVGFTDGRIDLTATGSFEAKADVLREKGIEWFVEDRLETCFDLSTAGIEPILFRQPWNRKPHPFREVGDWHELARIAGI